MNKNIGAFLIFNRDWFLKHQRGLLWLLQFRLFRWTLLIKTDKQIIQILPDCYTILGEKEDEFITDFRTHPKYAKRMYFAFKPLWWLLHYWDLIFDILAPRLSFGFATLTAFPTTGAGLGNGFLQDGVDGDTWATKHDKAVGTNAIVDAEDDWSRLSSSATANRWSVMTRSVFIFDTSSIGAGATVTAATFSGWATQLADNFSQSVNIVNHSLAGGTVLVTSHYDKANYGTTVYASATLASLSTGAYSDFVLDANGRANVNKTGNTALSMRFSGDVSNTEPTYVASTIARFFGFYADNPGTANDPKLVVTYFKQRYRFMLQGIGM